ncbi:cytochrome P450, family 81, subfamily D, polypeptide 5 [Actinidia rufa]|uniref:Cytochrome P450, family 81, subfamily D, polypeptide 5 n=1 Tax=Actinidia rufa TaxID=165716 RepID=A0A7J0GH98_9ERIC|nr:cytochrome P450, family 81, subfamily D, polypeptide 5 [Actinidia rufa]
MEPATWLYFISLATFLSLLLLILLKPQTPPKKPPPSPLSLPIIGHLHLLKEPIHRTLHRLATFHGPILALRFGSRPVLVISSPSAVEECFSKNDILFANRPGLLPAKHFNYNFTTLAASPYGHHWRNLRRLTTLEIFSTTKLNTFLSIRQEEVKSLLKSLIINQQTKFAKVEMKSRLSALSFNIIMRMVSGKRYFGAEAEDSEEARRFRVIICEIFELSGTTNPGDFVPFLGWIDFGNVERRMVKIQKEADEFLQGLIDEIRNNEDPNGGGRRNKSMIDSMLALQESEPEYASDEMIKGNILNMLSAGTDTSSVTIEWAMSLLLNHPEILRRARAELDEIIGEDRLVDEPDLINLPYLQNIINETLRLFPAAPLLLPHESSGDCTIGGFDVPRGTMLLANAWAIHRDPKWWDDPTSFKPERHESKEGDPYKFIPFGIGRRSCPGAGLANRVMGLALAGLIQCFEWERVSEELVDMSEGQGLTMPKLKPLETMCRPRERMIRVLSEL